MTCLEASVWQDRQAAVTSGPDSNLRFSASNSSWFAVLAGWAAALPETSCAPAIPTRPAVTAANAQKASAIAPKAFRPPNSFAFSNIPDRPARIDIFVHANVSMRGTPDNDT